jgi:ADP-ribose diphosphatase
MRQKPTVLASEIVASSRLFRVEQLQLRFSNGVERTYERLASRGHGHGAVMVVAMADAEHALLVEEYCAGTDDYQLSLPKGLVEPGEDVLLAADRELKEEAGFGARKLTYLRSITLAPTYMTHAIDLILAEDLYPERLVGDEPELLEVLPWRLDNLHELVVREDCSEGRSMAALLYIKEMMARRP